MLWYYFGLEANENGIPKVDKEQKPVCHKCKKSVPVKGGITSNLMSHLKEHHSDLCVEALSAQRVQQPRENTSSSDKNLTSMGSLSGESNTSSSTTIKDVLMASCKYNPKSSQAVELNKSIAYFSEGLSTFVDCGTAWFQTFGK